MNIVQIIGVAGSGKSTLVREMTSRWQFRQRLTRPITHEHWLTTDRHRMVTLGHYDTAFGGTDTLAFAAIEHMEHFISSLAERTVHSVIVEGDRLANDRFVTIAQTHGRYMLYQLVADDELLHMRRVTRAAQLGRPPQADAWLKGRASKVQRFAHRHSATQLDATQPVTQLADHIITDTTCPYDDPA